MPPKRTTRVLLRAAEHPASSSSSLLRPWASPEEFLPAAESGDDATVASALRNSLVDPNMTNECGDTALMMASYRCRPSVVTVLLADERVDPNITDEEFGNTALILATSQRHISVVKLLLADSRVDPNIANNHGKTALSVAAGLGGDGNGPSLKVLRLLLADDRVIRTRPNNGGEYYDAALAWVNRQGTDAEAEPIEFLPAAAKGDDATVASALRNPLVDPNMTSEGGDTALMMAVNYKRGSVVEMLLADMRIDPNIANQNGHTALRWAANLNICSEILEPLLADHRTIRTRPPDDVIYEQTAYDTALRNVKRLRNARFRGIIRAMVVFRRMRLRAAQAVYAPGGAGFAAAAASFNAAAANQLG